MLSPKSLLVSLLGLLFISWMTVTYLVEKYESHLLDREYDHISYLRKIDDVIDDSRNFGKSVSEHVILFNSWSSYSMRIVQKYDHTQNIEYVDIGIKRLHSPFGFFGALWPDLMMSGARGATGNIPSSYLNFSKAILRDKNLNVIGIITFRK